MLRHWIFNFPRVHACCGIGYSMLQHSPFCQFSGFCLFPNVAALGLQCCSIEATANFSFSSNAAALGDQCCSIHLFFFHFVPFCLLSFFFSVHCSIYHLQHKIPHKCVQDDNNTNKITKYEALKHVKFHSYHNHYQLGLETTQHR